MVVESKTVATLEETIAALLEMRDSAKLEGHTADTVYLNLDLKLVEETLTDGSKVMNIEARELA